MAYNSEALKSYWWEQTTGNVHETLFGITKFLAQNQTYRREANLRHMRLYGNLNLLGLSVEGYTRINTTDRLTLNIVQSMCDTVTQKIAKNKPKPTFLTSGGDYTLKKKAKLLEKFVQGQFYAAEVYDKTPKTFLEGAVFGTGAIKIFRDGKQIEVERTFIDELQADDSESIHGKPRSLYQTKPISKEVMVRLYPKLASQILACKRADHSSPTHNNLSNQINVLEAWHLPSGKDAKDGRHVICIENETLLDEPYTKAYFPFVFSKWAERLLGFFGQGLAEQLTGLQVEINKILRTIQRAFELCVPKMMVMEGSSVVTSHLNNEIGGIIKFKGEKPEWTAFQAVHPELFQHLERLYQKAYEIAGVSQLAAQSKKPGGLDSGKALREFNDIESERFILQGQAWEKLHMDLAKQMIDLGKDIHEEFKHEGGYSVVARSKKFIETINWAEIDLEEDQYMMQIFPTSMLSSTPSGRLQDVQDLIQAGFIDKANGLRLLDFPDLESYTNLANAAIEDIEDAIEAITDRGEYQSPEPYQNLATGIQMMQSAYLRAKNDQVDEEKLELLRRWMSEASAMQAPPPALAAPGMPGGTPMAVPTAPPTSELLPNVPGAAPLN